MTSIKKRINWIDWAKTLGILLVVLGHMYYSEDQIYFKKLIYGFHMPFFFLISGYLHIESKDFFKKNLLRLILPYFVLNLLLYCLFYIPKCLLGDIEIEGSFFLLKKACFYTMFTPFSFPTWFLLALFWVKLAAHCLLKLKIIYASGLSILLAISGYFLYHLIGYSMPFFVQMPFFIFQGLVIIPFFMFGYYLKKYNIVDLLYSKKNISFPIIFLFLMLYMYGVAQIPILNYVVCDLTTQPFFAFFLSIIGSCIFIMFCRCLNRYSNNIVRRLSMGTIIIMAFHLNLYIEFMEVYTRYFNYSILVSIILYSLMMVFFYFFIGFVQKNRIMSFLFMGRSLKMK